MYSSMKESDIQFQLHFLDCKPNSIFRSLNDKSVFDHLNRAATNKIFKFDKSYQRKEANRVTDIDQLSLLINPDLSQPKTITKYLPIEITKNDMRKISIPIVNNFENKTSSIEVKKEIPNAPPLPPELDLAIKLQSQSMKTAVLSPDRDTLWTSIENQNVAAYFDQLANPINYKHDNTIKQSRNNTILDSRKVYNLGMTYDKLARAIRYYYNNGVIRQTPGRFTFRFDWASGFGSTWIPT